MIIIRVMGGLGNQMSQYALYRKFKELGKKVKLDVSLVNKKNAPHGGLGLKRAFGLEPEFANEKEIQELGDISCNIFSRIRRRALKKMKTTYYEEPLPAHYMPEILQLDTAYLSGYWSSIEYFYDIKDAIVHDFTFERKMDDNNLEISKRILSTNSVSIHIRRGDYLSKQFRAIYENICTPEYYMKAMKYFRDKYKDVQFFIFSNDPEWVHEVFTEEDETIVDWNNNPEDSYYDMYLMSICRHNILANSSFSWWAGFLNKNGGGGYESIAPSKWNNLQDTFEKTSWLENWIKM